MAANLGGSTASTGLADIEVSVVQCCVGVALSCVDPHGTPPPFAVVPQGAKLTTGQEKLRWAMRDTIVVAYRNGTSKRCWGVVCGNEASRLTLL